MERAQLSHHGILRDDVSSRERRHRYHPASRRESARPAAPKVEIKDPRRLLQWLGKDRAMVNFADAKEISAKRRLFDTVLKEWIRFV